MGLRIAIDAFKAKASDYLLKPVEKDNLFAALGDAASLSLDTLVTSSNL